MKARVKATGEIVEVIVVRKYSSNNEPMLYYECVGSDVFYKEESLDFENLTEGLMDVKEKSLPKDEPDYWYKLKHQYAGMMLAGMLANSEWEGTYEILSECAIDAATALVEKLKNEK